MLVFLNRIAYVERLACMDMLEIFAHIERDAVKHLSGCIVDKLKLDMLQMLPDEFARTEIKHSASAEHRLLIARSKRIKLAEQIQEFGRYL